MDGTPPSCADRGRCKYPATIVPCLDGQMGYPGRMPRLGTQVKSRRLACRGVLPARTVVRSRTTGGLPGRQLRGTGRIGKTPTTIGEIGSSESS